MFPIPCLCATHWGLSRFTHLTIKTISILICYGPYHSVLLVQHRHSLSVRFKVTFKEGFSQPELLGTHVSHDGTQLLWITNQDNLQSDIIFSTAVIGFMLL